MEIRETETKNCTGQLCWSCSRVCSTNMCSKFKFGKTPEGVQFNSKNFIIYCPEFSMSEREKERKQAREKKRQTVEKVELLGISYRTYCRNKEYWEKKFNLLPEEQ